MMEGKIAETKYDQKSKLRFLLTFSVATGLREGMTVSQHGWMGHCDSHGASFFAGFILDVRSIKGKKTSFIRKKKDLVKTKTA